MKHYSLAVLLCIGSVACAQDMPLHEIIKAGEAWRTHSGPVPKVENSYRANPANRSVTHGDLILKLPLEEPSCTAVWHGGGTLLVGDAAGRHVWAYRIEKDGTLTGGDRYCPLRVRKGETRSEISALCVDRHHRVYAATKEGIQIFDPTGRMCGVILRPTPDKITLLTFVGNELHASTGTKHFVRTMLAEGPPQPK